MVSSSETLAPQRNARRSCVFARWLQKFCGRSTQCSSSSIRLPPRMDGDKKISGNETVISVDDQNKAAADDEEELNLAIALSLAENAKRPKGFKDHGGDSDEDLARAIQENLNMTSKSHPNNPVQVLPRGHRVCGGCKRQIGDGYYLSCKGIFWHTQCFRCHACSQAIQDTEFYLSGRDPYHKSCYRELHHPKCDVCHQFIPPSKADLIEYRVHPYWGQKYCPSHERDNTPRCCSCERMESLGVKHVLLGDGRSLCLVCLDTAIMDAADCQFLYHSIRDFYEGMNMKIEQQIPMLLVERQALNEAMEGEKEGHHRMPETRGLCLSEEQTVSSITSRKPRISRNQEILDMTTQTQKLIRICEVTAILVLYGLPRLLTGAILAHELMHAWFRLKGGYRDLSPKVEEGICQVLSQMWLESEVSHAGSRSIPAADFASSSSSSSSSKKATGKSDTEKELGKFFMHQIANDVSVAYGEGFRAANEAVNKYGLRQTLDHIHSTGHLPVPWAPNVELLQQNFTPCQTKYCGLAVPCAISMSFQ